jgi:hypothetical protein
MTETICAKCESHGESQWRIRLEHDTEGDDGQASYRLCRGCWNELSARFDGSER